MSEAPTSLNLNTATRAELLRSTRRGVRIVRVPHKPHFSAKLLLQHRVDTTGSPAHECSDDITHFIFSCHVEWIQSKVRRIVKVSVAARSPADL